MENYKKIHTRISYYMYKFTNCFKVRHVSGRGKTKSTTLGTSFEFCGSKLNQFQKPSIEVPSIVLHTPQTRFRVQILHRSTHISLKYNFKLFNLVLPRWRPLCRGRCGVLAYIFIFMQTTFGWIPKM